LAVRGAADTLYQVGILLDTDEHYANLNLLDRYLMQPGILKAFGWRFAFVLTKDWYHNPDEVIGRLERILQGQLVEAEPESEETPEESNPASPENNSPTSEPSAQPNPGKSPAPSPSSPAQTPALPGSTRHFEFIGGGSKKFWEITVAENAITVRFGRIGASGQSQTKSFIDEAKAKREAENLIAEKRKKGYIEKE
jgi:predicted DNA-binding WGR domain protein